MEPIQQASVDIEDRSVKDSVTPLRSERENRPAIVSISDIHGYLDRARSALLTLRDRADFESVVVTDDSGRLQWADGDHVLVFNGDLIDRGPSNDEVLTMVARLATQAPPGRVRVTLGNHEAIALSADHFPYSNWYAGQSDEEDRLALLDAIRDGLVVASYRGYNHTYAHAGAGDPYDTGDVNDELVAAAADLRSALGTIEDVQTQRSVIDGYSRVLGVGAGHPKGPGAGLAWLDFSHLPANAPPQVVGHTRFETPQQKGSVFCQNLIRNNLETPGGEGVFVETPDTLSTVLRTAEGGTEVEVLRRCY